MRKGKQKICFQGLPKLMKFKFNKDCVKEILGYQIKLTVNLDSYVDVK